MKPRLREASKSCLEYAFQTKAMHDIYLNKYFAGIKESLQTNESEWRFWRL